MTEQTPLEVLTKARELISDPARWTQGATARRASGGQTEANHPEACQWCAVGAIAKVLDVRHFTSVPSPFRSPLDREVGSGTVVLFNDERTHAQVLSLFDRAIERLQQKEA